MYQFFFCLYYALFEGTWRMDRSTNLTEYLNRVSNLILNVLGGDYQALQRFDIITEGLNPYGLMANILAIITMFGVCFAVLKLVKQVFSIFFGGR